MYDLYTNYLSFWTLQGDSNKINNNMIDNGFNFDYCKVKALFKLKGWNVVWNNG